MRNGFYATAVLLCCLFAVFSMAIGQEAPVAVVKVEAQSPQELHNMHMEGATPSTGLNVVGNGELVYLVAMEAGGAEVTAYSWSISEAPDGSQATLDSTDTHMTTMRTDLVGQYMVKCMITTAGGTAEGEVEVIAANYVGVGNYGDATPNVGEGQCAAFCHNDKVAEWEETGHATIFIHGINGTASDHYAERCISCHTLGYDTSPEADNGGFDDVAEDLGWTFPTVLQEGNWEDIVTNYIQLAQRANVQCENCHGPGSQHIGNPQGTDVSLDEGLCGRCHEEEPYHRKNQQWKNSSHAIGIPFAANRAGCADCHSGYGFIKITDPGNMLDQTTGAPEVSCAVCHDPHSNALPAQVRKLDDVTLGNGEVVSFGGNGKLCMNCHKGRRDAETYATEYHDHYGPHYSAQTDMLAGTNAIEFEMHIPSTNHKFAIENGCVTCHMAPTAPQDSPAWDKIGEHSFAMSYDNGTPDDPSDDIDNVASCVGCHGPITSFDDVMAKEDYDGDGMIEAAQAEISGLMDKVGMLLPPMDDPHVEVAPDYNDVQLLAAFNWAYVEEDQSHGIHNLQYAVGLLKAAHMALTTGTLSAGDIVNIEDVPNDQGKQVRVTWTGFGADGVSANGVKMYSLWRRVDPVDNTQKVRIAKTLALGPQEIEALEPGAMLNVDGTMWDFAGSVPAKGSETYSAIAPTLYDSTASDGVVWSVFKVVGHTDVTAMYAASAPDSGYSIDNLEPMAPANVAASMADGAVQVNWDPAQDDDVSYFSVYRATREDFEPTESDLVAKIGENEFIDTDVMPGTTYFYRIGATDFSGNASALSSPVSVVVTSVGKPMTEAVPSDFGLDQNYPNPFNPSTNIRFALPKDSHVQVVIYNLTGAKVRTLASGRFASGYHTLVWDGRDASGQVVSAGTFLYRLETPQTQLTRKMLFLK
ncbi:T9SS type A sorting domain-containing protein [candidate division KSB1 bacterium]|nr:T9SS type A sorting domain-containing protein [candidate division KSB1 bacterium]